MKDLTDRTIIRSIIDTDLYKLTMMFAVAILYPWVHVKYAFINRGKTVFPKGFAEALKGQVKRMQFLALTPYEKGFLQKKTPFLSPVYLDLLEGYRFNPDEVTVTQRGGDLKITIEGPWYRTILWEVPLMALISELYFQFMARAGKPADTLDALRMRNKTKAMMLAGLGIIFSEFGSRRRYSFVAQDEALKALKGRCNMVGTSNVFQALYHHLIPVGTMAHEWIQAHAALFGFGQANEAAMDAWVNVYQGNLGIALTDTFTTDVFLRSFNTKYAKLFDGVRQDSGDPLKFIPKIVKHYEKLRIDPMSKVILFSDGLNDPKMLRKIHKACEGKIMDRYGIGTWLSNDCGVKPLNIVIKLMECNGIPTVKLSDVTTKNTGKKSAISLCKRTLGL